MAQNMTHPFFDPLAQHFGILPSEYGFRVTSQQYDEEGFGAGMVRLESERYFVDFQLEGMGPQLSIYAGRTGERATDLAWIFAYLTRPVNPGPSGATAAPQAAAPPQAAAWLYYFPHMALGIWGEASIAWQMARLADALKCMWPAIFIFLDMNGTRGADFLAFQEHAKRAAAEREADGYLLPAGQLAARAPFNFPAQVQKSFAFLTAYGYKIVTAGPIFVRLETERSSASAEGQPTTYVNIFHRLRSYQLGLHTGLARSDLSLEMNFDLAELAAWASQPYTPAAVRAPGELAPALNRMARLFRRCAAPSLAGDQRLFEALLGRRIDAARRASRAWEERNRR